MLLLIILGLIIILLLNIQSLCQIMHAEGHLQIYPMIELNECEESTMILSHSSGGMPYEQMGRALKYNNPKKVA